MSKNVEQNDQRNRDAEEKPTTSETKACGSGSRDCSALNTAVSASCIGRVPYPLQYALPELEQTLNGMPLLRTTWRWNREGKAPCEQICIEKRPHTTIEDTGEVLYLYVAYRQSDSCEDWRQYLTTAGDFVYFPTRFPRGLPYPCRFFETCCFVSLEAVVARLQASLDAELMKEAK